MHLPYYLHRIVRPQDSLHQSIERFKGCCLGGDNRFDGLDTDFTGYHDVSNNAGRRVGSKHSFILHAHYVFVNKTVCYKRISPLCFARDCWSWDRNLCVGAWHCV